MENYKGLLIGIVALIIFRFTIGSYPVGAVEYLQIIMTYFLDNINEVDPNYSRCVTI